MSWKRLLLTVLKIGLSIGIIVYLVIQARNNNAFEELGKRPKNWWCLSAAAACIFFGVVITLVRWYYLVRALGIPFRLRDAFRLGFLGYLFNLAPMGIVSGDLLKAVMLAREQHGHRAAAVASIVVDRVIGLYVLFVVASSAIVCTGLWHSEVLRIQQICRLTFAVTAVGTLAVILPLLPFRFWERFLDWIERLPTVGRLLKRLIEAVRLYRFAIPTLLVASGMSVAVHSFISVGFYLIAAGLYENVHSLGTHLVITPLANATGVIPLTMGPLEVGLDYLYAKIPLADGGRMLANQGFVVALAYRFISLLVAGVGVAYYFASRGEVAEVMHEAELEEDCPSLELEKTQV